MVRRSEWIRIALTGCIAFHLFAVLLAPNAQSYLGVSAAWVVEPYLSFLELTNTWSFFAPDPGVPPVFMVYEVFDKQGKSLTKGRFPDFPDGFFLRERQNRRVAAVEFMIISEIRSEKMMLPYLCHQVAGADSVSLFRGQVPIPSIWEVREGKQRVGDESRMDQRLVSHSFCEQSLDAKPVAQQSGGRS